MAERPKGMGRGLAAILSVAPRDELQELRAVPIDLIDPSPNQPRHTFDEDSLMALAGSIRARGILQPVLVRPLVSGRYELIAGERRWRAAQLAELVAIPADRAPSRRRGIARGGADREHGARGPQPGRRGPRLRRARRGARPHPRGSRPQGRPQPGRRLEPDPPARPPRRGARADRARRPHRGPRARPPARHDHAARRTLARDAARARWSVRELESRARAADGPAGKRRRARSRPPSIPTRPPRSS